MSLQIYRKKRDFSRTPEPAEDGVKHRSKTRFVIQKHDATRLHYDLRLELGGTLVSWAVPKGLPMKHGEKRLAVKVEDHPLSYAKFEGVIPAGQYGGGTVMLWDEGTYVIGGKHPAKDLSEGKLHFTLSGHKLKGEWYLVRLREAEQWLVIRGGPDHPVIPAGRLDASVLSGKTMAQLAGPAPKAAGTPLRPLAKPSSARSPAPQGKAPAPMMAKLVVEPPSGDWEYEIKFDGFRSMIRKEATGTVMYSRNGKDFTAKFPEIAEAIDNLKAKQVLIDGEVVALDPTGKSSFALLQALEQGSERPSIYFYAFDLLESNGISLVDHPLEERKAKLQKILPSRSRVIRFSPLLGRDAPALLEMTRKHQLEGLIGKRVGSAYEPGRRSGTWIKLKQQTGQEFVIGGYTNPGGSRKHFGALLVGYYEKDELRYAGKVGTGFTERQLSGLRVMLEKTTGPACPFHPPPEPGRGRYGQGFTAEELQACHWVKPRLVAQVKFTEWTQDGRLRHPVFLGLRDDKPARKIIRETPARL